MKFKKLTSLFEELESTRSGNEMRSLISELLKETSSEEIDDVVYLLLGQISAKHEEVNTDMGETLVMKSVSLMSDKSEEEVEELFNKEGDLGTVAERVKKEKKPELRVEEVREKLLKIAEKSGSGSQDYKLNALSELLKKASKREARYIPRIVLGSLRMGVGDKTVLDALSIAFTGSKSKREELEKSYNICPDIGVISQEMSRNGLEGVKSISVKIGRPIQSMLAQRVKDIEKIKEKMKSEVIACEEKYDGERVQAHYNEEGVKLYSRRLVNITQQFPDVVQSLKKDTKGENFILDGEVVAVDEEGNLEPFQKLMQRRRKYEVQEYVEKVPVKYFVFDVLYYDNKSYLEETYDSRKEALKGLIKEENGLQLARVKRCESIECMEEFFNDCISHGAEGIIAKDTSEDSAYKPGKREWNWIKWKQDYQKMADTLDLVVVGAYHGKGKRAGTYGALLCAVYNEEEDRFETLCKLGSGFTDEELEELPEKLGEYEAGGKPARLIINKDMEPDVYFQPGVVVEVKGAEFTKSPSHTAGKNQGGTIALRFPRFVKYRLDKSPEQATSVEEIIQLMK